MKSCNCGRSAPGSTTCLVLFDRKENGAEKKTTEVLGAVETVCCDACLVRYARKSILKSILGFIAGVIVISLLAGLINRVFRLSWVGGGLLIFALLGNLIRNIAQTIGKTQKNGAAYEAYDRYRKQGSIPAGDFFYLTLAGKNMLSDNGLSLAKTDSFDPSDIILITDWALEESLKSAPDDSSEVAGIRSAFAECHRQKPEDKLTEPPKIRKAFYEPIPAFFLILLTAAVSVLVFYEGFDVKDSYFFVVGGIMAVLGLGGAIMLVVRKKAIWYLPLIAMIALFWVADAHIWGEDLQYHLEEPVIISAVILIVALCWLPYVRKKRDEKQTEQGKK